MKLSAYMTAEPVGTEPEVYIVRSRHGDALGTVEWYAPWRQYVLSPESAAVLSADCLEVLAGFCQRLKDGPPIPLCERCRHKATSHVEDKRECMEWSCGCEKFEAPDVR